VIIGLGWDVAEPKSGGIFGSLFGKKETAEYDLDAIAVLLGRDGKMIRNTDVVFYNQMQHPSGCATLTGDNRTGAGDGDDEQIIVRLNSLASRIRKNRISRSDLPRSEKRTKFRRSGELLHSNG
jgi:stress response protein SCP2